MRLLSAFAIAFITARGNVHRDFCRLPRAPRKENETWSDCILATQRVDLTPVPKAERIAVRYRVRKSE